MFRGVRLSLTAFRGVRERRFEGPQNRLTRPGLWRRQFRDEYLRRGGLPAQLYGGFDDRQNKTIMKKAWSLVCSIVRRMFDGM
jgi:hypothetical protein